jgi:hypothetical protein
VHLPAPSTEILAPQDVKLSTLAPEPCEPLEIMEPNSEALSPTKCHPAAYMIRNLFFSLTEKEDSW